MTHLTYDRTINLCDLLSIKRFNKERNVLDLDIDVSECLHTPHIVLFLGGDVERLLEYHVGVGSHSL
jgi:hypothetical protein